MVRRLKETIIYIKIEKINTTLNISFTIDSKSNSMIRENDPLLCKTITNISNIKFPQTPVISTIDIKTKNTSKKKI